MRVFNVILNGEDAKEFCNQSTDFKIRWIKNNTNQKDMAMIMDFINNPPKDKNGDCGCGCGGKKEKKVTLEISSENSIENSEKIQSEDEPIFRKKNKFKRD